MPTSPTHIQAMRHATQQKHGNQSLRLLGNMSSMNSTMTGSSCHNLNNLQMHHQQQLQPQAQQILQSQQNFNPQHMLQSQQHSPGNKSQL